MRIKLSQRVIITAYFTSKGKGEIVWKKSQ